MTKSNIRAAVGHTAAFLCQIYSDVKEMMSEERKTDLFQEAAKWREKFDIPVIGVTGSNGKTTTTLILSTILSQVGAVLQNPYDADDAQGVALTLLNIRSHHNYVILKMGARSAGEIRTAAEVASPTIGIVTNVGEAHLDYFGTKNRIALAKSELVRMLPKNGLAVLNKENDFTSNMDRRTCAENIIYFGLHPSATCRAENIEFLGPHGTRFTMRCGEGYVFDIHLPIYSLGDVYNALAAISTAFYLELEVPTIQKALQETLRLPAGRGRLHEFSGLRLIDDTYDCNPQSLIKSACTLCNFKNYSNRLILVIGDMSGLGSQAAERHQHMGEYLSSLPIDMVFAVGRWASSLLQGVNKNRKKRQGYEIPKVEEVVEKLIKLCEPGDTLLITGSFELNMGSIIEKLTQNVCSYVGDFDND